ncbi:GNAT family N-acetyltransferase [Paenibacillus flagellatus]|uniref:GNAT family N-acetyltransferase n=1 Tax=Paenibacillus flagellatus TaxID=2211139 RepID=A0A2V5K4Q0_9BACL|nr:GNAT family N-acetyltransferase [Paenibacillus flagellatus]PYI54251.1 GNAT family N-acetyltransferase [Paenibacillus flagellatus]
MRIREATIDDAEALARVHVESWRTTYAGIVSDDYLSNLSVGRRKAMWERTLGQSNPDAIVFVAEDREGHIVGFASCGRCRTEDSGYDGELYAIYMLKDYQGIGLGTRLVGEAAAALKRNGFQSMMVWVLERNRAVAFYRKLGGERFLRKEERIGEELLAEVAFGWKRLDDVALNGYNGGEGDSDEGFGNPAT